MAAGTSLPDAGTAKGKEAPPPFDFTIGTAALSSTALIDQLYEFVTKSVSAESGKQQRLDAKATSLLSIAGVSISVVFAATTQLIVKDWARHPGAKQWFVGAVLVMVVAGVATAVLALLSLRVVSYFEPDERAIFDCESLQAANRDEAAMNSYKRDIVVHLWECVQENRRLNRGKARWIQVGQITFALFLGATVIAGFVFICWPPH